MTGQLDIYAIPPTATRPDGHVGPDSGLTIEETFWRFHHDNPHVYDELVRLARRARSRGAGRIGIGMLFEVLRWQHTINTTGHPFLLNNNWRSYYARLIMNQEPELDGIFETRRLHTPEAHAA